MGVFFTLAPCTKNKDGTYQDISWARDDGCPQPPKFEVKLPYILDLFRFNVSIPDYEGESFEDLWWLKEDESKGFLESDLDSIPENCLRDPRAIKGDIERLRIAVEKHNYILPLYDCVKIRLPSVVDNAQRELTHILLDGSFYCCRADSLGAFRLNECDLVFDPKTQSHSISETLVSRSISNHQTYPCYVLENLSDAAIKRAVKRQEQGDTQDLLSIDQEDFYSHFSPYFDQMEEVCDYAIANNYLLIAGYI